MSPTDLDKLRESYKTAYRQNNYQAAVDYLNEYLSVHPDDRDALNIKTRCEYILRRQQSMRGFIGAPKSVAAAPAAPAETIATAVPESPQISIISNVPVAPATPVAPVAPPATVSAKPVKKSVKKSTKASTAAKKTTAGK